MSRRNGNGNGSRIVRRPTDPEQLVEIGFIHYGTVRTEFMLSVLRTYIHDAGGGGGHFDHLWSQDGPYIPANRCSVVRSFLERKRSAWLLFVDNDMVFDGDAMGKLLELADPVERPIVAGLYVTPMTNDGETRTLPTWTHEHDGKPLRLVMEVPEGDELMELHSCGMGLTLIHRSVLEAVGEAHKHDEWPWFGHDLREFDPEIGPVRCGEDVTFCCRARALGFTIWGAPHIRAAHAKSAVLGAEDVLPALRMEVK